jgi:hypothetical protein
LTFGYLFLIYANGKDINTVILASWLLTPSA